MSFEVFRLIAHSQLVQFTLTHIDMTITIVIINLQTGNVSGVWMTSCSEGMVLRIGGFWKESVEIGPWRQIVQFMSLRHRVEFSTVAAAVKFFGSRPGEMNWDFRHQKMRSASGWGSHSKNCVSLLVSPWTEVKKLINPFVSETTESACICICLLSPVFSYLYITKLYKMKTKV